MDKARRGPSDRGSSDEREDARGPGESSNSEADGRLLSSAQFDSLVRALGLKKRSQLKLLVDVLSSVREQDAQFRRAFLATARSKTERWLRGIGNNPGRLASEIVKRGGEATVAGLETAVLKQEGLSMLLFNFAELVAPQGQGAEWIRDRSAHRALLGTPAPLQQIRDAAARAKTNLGATIRRAPGDRRQSDATPRSMMVEHLLETYVDLTGLQPSVTFNPIISERSGPALELLRLTLTRLGYVASDMTLQREIERYRDGRLRRRKSIVERGKRRQGRFRSDRADGPVQRSEI